MLTRWRRVGCASIRTAVAAVTCGFLLVSCSLIELRQQADEFYASTVLVGRITSTTWTGPVVVVARPTSNSADDATAPAAAHAFLHEPGGFELIVPKGRYRLQAFGDANGNLRVDAGEHIAHYRGEPVVEVSGGGLIGALDMVLAPARDVASDLPEGFSVAGRSPVRHSTQVGAIADLDSPLFSAEKGRLGYWEPMRFFRELGGNVYFLEPYDPRKTPVLFVHGAAGSPQDWRYFLSRLDRQRYQPWIFYYPSGAPVESMSHLLYWKLLNLQLKYGFRELVVTAHSMGGLVARSFLVNQGAQFAMPKLFVSVSTPWGGEPSAETGVRHSPAVVPSWHDMRPEGRFVRELFLRRLPPHTEYVLLFGHKGGYSLIRPTTDGTVTLASQLKSPAQAEARRVFGFDEDHVSILFAPDVFAQYAAVLDDPAWRSAGRSAAQDGGTLRVSFVVPQREAGGPVTSSPAPRQIPLLVLDRLDAGAERITLLLGPDETSREIGSLPTGQYHVRLIVDAFRSEPSLHRVSVQPGAPAEARFSLVEQGTLFGYVGRVATPVDQPSGSYVPPNETIRLRSISLEGAGLKRRLVPRTDGPADSFAQFADGKDDAVGPYFSFVGLLAGEYEVVIEADGYKTHRVRHVITPGRYGPMRPVLLTPLDEKASPSSG